MGSVFDSLVDMTLGLVSPVAPLVQPTFAPDRAPVLPIELEVIQDDPARRTVHVPAGTASPEPGRSISIVARDLAPAAAPPDGAPSPEATTRSILRAAMQPLVPLVEPGPSAPPPAVQPRTTPITAAPDVHAGGHTAVSVSVGGTTMLIAAADGASAEPRASVPGPRRAASAPRDHAASRGGDAPQGQHGAGGESVVRVTIGRVDVRAVHAREPAPRPSPVASRSSTALADYLRDRTRRGPR